MLFRSNDSGVAIPAMAATVAIPVAVAVVVRCMQLDDGGAVSELAEDVPALDTAVDPGFDPGRGPGRGATREQGQH